MKFILLLICVIGIGAAVGLSLPGSGPSAAPATAPSTEGGQGHDLLDYSRVVHAYREDVDQALHVGLHGAVRQGGTGSDEFSMASDNDGTLRLIQTTAPGG